MPWELQVNNEDPHLLIINPTDPPTWQTVRKGMTQAQAISLLNANLNDPENPNPPIDGVTIRIVEY